MFSIFKQASGTQDVVLKDLADDQLSEVAGGQHHHHAHHRHHHHHHHHTTWTGKAGTTGTTGTTGTATTTTGGVTYPGHSHW
ncbi:MAG TPA: hypothetical protein VGM01_12985 [Ktedonobacteraceae bacterium]